MRRKGQPCRLSGQAPRTRQGRAYDGAVTAMNAIEIADRYHRAGQRPLSTPCAPPRATWNCFRG